mmetsp:Transcript_20004/g.30066  ORF Transcript_20004/g.30066 Transcript_20004/m.30066 type:complete len:397 (+) Transcript_20004:47-1237(+)
MMSNRVLSILNLLCFAACAASASFQSLEVVAFVRGGADRAGITSEGDTPEWSNGEEDPSFDQSAYSINEDLDKNEMSDIHIYDNVEDDDNDDDEEATDDDKDAFYVKEHSADKSDDEGDPKHQNEDQESVIKEDGEDIEMKEGQTEMERGGMDDVNGKVYDREEEQEIEVEVEGSWKQNEYRTNFETEVIHPTIDDDSSAFVDREELADAYDDDETAVSSPALQTVPVENDDRASIDDIPRVEQSSNIQEYDETNYDSHDDTDIDIAAEEESHLEPMQDTVVTVATQQILVKKCGFKKSEIKGLKIHIANIIAEKRLRRPLDGIPSSWYDERKKSMIDMMSARKILRLAIPAVICVLALYSGFDIPNVTGMHRRKAIIFRDPRDQKEDQTEKISGL